MKILSRKLFAVKTLPLNLGNKVNFIVLTLKKRYRKKIWFNIFAFYVYHRK